MPHDDKLLVYYLDRTGKATQEKEDVYDWNGHRYSHEIDTHGNLVVYKVDHPKQEPPVNPIHVKTYARGIWTRVFLDYDEHATP